MITERIRDLARENKFNIRKGKAVVGGVLAAALIAAQKDKQNPQQIKQPMTESLQEVIKTLREELVSEREGRDHVEKLLAAEHLMNTKLLEGLQEAFARERELKYWLYQKGDMASTSSWGERTRKCFVVEEQVYSNYPWKKMKEAKENHNPKLRQQAKKNYNPKLRPLIKTEYQLIYCI